VRKLTQLIEAPQYGHSGNYYYLGSSQLPPEEEWSESILRDWPRLLNR
jgi:hypothetical protein